MKCKIFLLVALSVSILATIADGQAAALETHFYKKSCPDAEQIVRNIVWNHTSTNSALPAKLLRMFFHDCIVRGCDASVLLDSPNKDAEKNAVPNLSLAGFDVIDEVKTALEKACPDTVSCADIIAYAARDSVSFEFETPIWEIEGGRRDGTESSITEALNEIPSPFFNFSTLVESFTNKSLSMQDLVVLSGAHTIGTGSCVFVAPRLYNFTGKGDQDPAIDASYAKTLKSQCTTLSRQDTTRVNMDPPTPSKFDSSYYSIVKSRKGLFTSDATLLTDSRASNLIDKLTDQQNFLDAFKNSIRRMGKVGVLTGTNGEIRKTCNVKNS